MLTGHGHLIHPPHNLLRPLRGKSLCWGLSGDGYLGGYCEKAMGKGQSLASNYNSFGLKRKLA